MCTERNEAVLNDLPGELYTIETNNKIPDKYKYPTALFQVTQNQKKREKHRCLEKLLKFKICAKVMLTVTLREKCPNTEFFLVRFFPFFD